MQANTHRPIFHTLYRGLLLNGLSESYWEEAHHIPGMTIESEPEEMPFDEDGNMW